MGAKGIDGEHPVINRRAAIKTVENQNHADEKRAPGFSLDRNRSGRECDGIGENHLRQIRALGVRDVEHMLVERLASDDQLCDRPVCFRNLAHQPDIIRDEFDRVEADLEFVLVNRIHASHHVDRKDRTSGIPFDDPFGDRLRDWLGVDRAAFYDRSKFAVLPMAFCFPGYRKGSDLPPPPICAKTWRARAQAAMPQVKLTLLVGGYAQKWHLNDKGPVTGIVQNWRTHIPDHLPLPHPSWRNTGWLKKHPWFEAEVLPWLRNRVQEVLTND